MRRSGDSQSAQNVFKIATPVLSPPLEEGGDDAMGALCTLAIKQRLNICTKRMVNYNNIYYYLFIRV